MEMTRYFYHVINLCDQGNLFFFCLFAFLYISRSGNFTLKKIHITTLSIRVLLELFPRLVLLARLHLKESSLNSFCLRERNLRSRDIFVDFSLINIMYSVVLYNNGGKC